MLAGKTILYYINLFFLNSNKKNNKRIISNLRTNKANLEIRLNEIDEVRNYLLENIKNNDVMSEKNKHKKLCKAVNYVKHFFTFISVFSDCFKFSIYFINYSSCRQFKFYSRNKVLCNHCRN